MNNILFDSVSAIIEMPDSDKLLCYEYFESTAFPKNTIIEKAGKILNKQCVL